MPSLLDGNGAEKRPTCQYVLTQEANFQFPHHAGSEHNSNYVFDALDALSGYTSLDNIGRQVERTSRDHAGQIGIMPREETPCDEAAAISQNATSNLLYTDQQPNCSTCGSPILDRYLLKVCDNVWHEQCLCCSICDTRLAQAPSCYVREGKIFCKVDYKRIFGAKCVRCLSPLNSSDVVQRTVDGVYHATCFSCLFCGQLLQPGDQFVVNDGQLVCRTDYETIMQNTFGPGFKLTGVGLDRKAPKRPRTILTSQQRKAFKASFEISAKPCRKVRETLAKETGLSVRVVQVWFQNQRAKMKKIQRKQEQNSQKHGSASSANDGEKRGDGDEESPSSKGGRCRDIGSPASSTIDSSSDELDMSSGSPGFDTGDKTLDGQGGTSSGVGTVSCDSNPIDKLYLMQDSYFNF